MRRALLALLLVAAPVGAQPARTAAARALEMPGMRWEVVDARRARVHALAGTPASRRLPALARDVDRTIAAHLAWLGARRFDDTLRLFFVGSREQMRPFTGRTPGGWSITEEGTAFFVANDSVRPAVRHEVMHLLSWSVWGTPRAAWLSEGVASVAAGPCRGRAIDDAGAAMARAGALVPLDTLRRAFTYEGERGLVHYLQAASIVAYVDRAFGRAAVRTLWRTGDIRRTLGVDPATLERRWRASLGRRRPSFTWETLRREVMARGCE